MGDKKVHMGFWWGDLRERDHLAGLGTDGGTLLKWIFMKWYKEVWTQLIWLMTGTVGRWL